MYFSRKTMSTWNLGEIAKLYPGLSNPNLNKIKSGTDSKVGDDWNFSLL